MKHAFKNLVMSKNTFYNNILTNGGPLEPVSTVGFFFYRESLRILPNLITSRLKQRLTIELFKTTERACNEPTVLSCDLNIIRRLLVVMGYL